MSLPASLAYTNAVNQAAKKTWGEGLRDSVALIPGTQAYETKTISSDAITPTRGCVVVDTEAAAATDDLSTIATTNFADGAFLIITPANAGRVPTLKHNVGGAGKFVSSDGKDVVLDATTRFLVLQLNGTQWEDRFRIGFDNEGTHVAKTAGYSIVANDNGKTISNDGAGGAVTLILPELSTLPAKWRLRLLILATQTLTLQMGGGDTVRVGATVSTAGGTLASGTIGNVVELMKIDNDRLVALSAPIGTWSAT